MKKLIQNIKDIPLLLIAWAFVLGYVLGEWWNERK